MTRAASVRMLAIVVAGGAAARAAAELAGSASSTQCATEGSHCSFFAGCCDGLDCKRQGVLDWKCQARCVPEGQTCGGPGLAEQACCGGLRCERKLMGTHDLQCVRGRAEQCKARGDICGCAGCQTMTCCGGLTCGEVMGQGGKQYCVDVPGAASSLAAANVSAMAAAAVAAPSAATDPLNSTAPFYP